MGFHLSRTTPFLAAYIPIKYIEIPKMHNQAAMLHLAKLYNLYDDNKIKNVRGHKGVVRATGLKLI